MIQEKRYPLDQCRLYKLTTRRKLAAALLTTEKDIRNLLKKADNYIRFSTTNGRNIQWPKPGLRRIQKRIATLLSHVETPDFLHSAVRGRSYITNAKQHNISEPTIKVDIKKFFETVRAPAVYNFFRNELRCATDVSAILTKLVTADGHLPTGGNVSPILSYFAYADMFHEIEALSKSRNCTMSCLMDDMSFTGSGATKNLIYEVRQIISRYRLHAHKTRQFRVGQPRVITGVAVTKAGFRVPNKRQKAIARDFSLLASATSDDSRLTILPQLIGRVHEAAQIDPKWLPRARLLVTQRRDLKRRSLMQGLPSEVASPAPNAEVRNTFNDPQD